MANANANPVGCGSEGGQPDELVIVLEAQSHCVHPAPAALRICVMNRVEATVDEIHVIGVQLDEVTVRRRVVVVDRWTHGSVYHFSS